MAPSKTSRKITQASIEDVSHQTISSYFIGPRAENLDIFKDNIDVILEEIRKARINYLPDANGEDDSFITNDIKASPAFIKGKERLGKAVAAAANLLGRHSIPFWSPRYQAHMCTDMSMASLLGYFMTMIYNPNNVALEASPLTTVAEIEVGEQLCDLFGFSTDEDDTDTPTGWGHVTCDGTVANLESIWVARNLKFYPLSLRRAMDPDTDGPLAFLADRFRVETCVGERKLLVELSTWELLNLKPTDVLDLPDRLHSEHGISNDWLSAIMDKYTAQSVGKDTIEREYGIDKPIQYMLATSRHYSWPKGGAICGIGSANIVGVPVDDAARVDIDALDRMLAQSVEEQRAVYAVVGIVGSTEEGAVDSISSILALRKQYQAQGLSFLVHADAAWGGYFCSMLPRGYHPGDVLSLPVEVAPGAGFVPEASLRPETQDDLYAMRFVDSITVDPHKAGYIPYPAGGLCYRDGRMRFLVTWTSPYLSRGSVTSIGIYGVEGSKPGASAMSTWLSNKAIGLSQEGYGTLLGEVTWTCTRLSAEWAALTDGQSPFVCVPFNKTPAEAGPDPTPEKIEAEKARIRRDIIDKTNLQIVTDDVDRPEDQKAITLLRALGSDLNINAFALNFRHTDGCLNDDVEEANYLMQRVVERLSVDSPSDDPTKIPLYLTSTEFSDELYGDCKKSYMARLGLANSTQDLMVLRNVVMSPFPTDRGFIRELAQVLYDTAAEETEIVRRRNEVSPDFYSFLLQGTDDVFAVHLPMFHVANHRQQLVIAVELTGRARDRYAAMKRSNPYEPMILVTAGRVYPDQISNVGGSFLGHITTKQSGSVLRNVTVTVKRIVASRPLNSKWRLPDYPQKSMPFYLYGESAAEANIDHILVRAPNTQLSAGRCKLELESGSLTGGGGGSSSGGEGGESGSGGSGSNWWDRTRILVLDDVYEAPMQPFPPNAKIGGRNNAILPRLDYGLHHNDESSTPSQQLSLSSVVTSSREGGGGQATAGSGAGFFFRPGVSFKVSVYDDPSPDDESPWAACFERGEPVGKGTLVIGDSVYIDSEAMNIDPFKRVETVTEWRREFDLIGRNMD